jgi:flagellin-specific chaperone FliS
MIARMIRANIDHDAAQLDGVESVLRELREAWVEAIRMQRVQRTQGAVGA